MGTLIIFLMTLGAPQGEAPPTGNVTMGSEIVLWGDDEITFND